MPPSSYMFSPGAYQASTTPTFMEDLEDPNPTVDPETVNREFYQLDKVRETVLKLVTSVTFPVRVNIFDTHSLCSTYACRYYSHNWMM